MTKNQFCRRYNIELQAFRRFVQLGLLRIRTKWFGKVKRLLIEPSEIEQLTEGKHYVVCPFCGRKAIELNDKHYRACPKNYGKYLLGYSASTFYEAEKKKTEAQKIAQSLKLRARFQTPAGDITRKQISIASRNVSDATRSRKVATLERIRNDPTYRERIRKESLARWKDPEFRKRIQAFQHKNREKIVRSAAHARTYRVFKSSGLHKSFKKAMLNNGIYGFESEYRLGFYSIDEACSELKLAIEIDGCFWHGCKICGFKGIRGTQNTDNRKAGYLKTHGWALLRIPEHDIKQNLSECLERVKAAIGERRGQVNT